MSHTPSRDRLRRIGPMVLPAGLAELHDSENGMISLVSVVVILFILVLIGLVANVGSAVNRKIEVQNSADAAAYTSAIWMARGMNSITATNHLIGEMQALVVIHIAVGGEELEDKEPLDPQEANEAKGKLNRATTQLFVAWGIAEAAGIITIACPKPGELVGERVKAGATVRAGMTDLKSALAKVYLTKAAAKLLEATPVALLGIAIEAAALVIELLILAEYTALKAMEVIARSAPMLFFRNLLFDQLLPNASDFEQLAVDNVPRYAAESAKAIAEKNGTTGATYPAEPPLPVLRDRPTGKRMADADMPRCTLVRATFPWVKYDRTPLLRFMGWMSFSHARAHYLKYTNNYTLLKSKELYNGRSRDFAMYVMTKPGENKGSEPWTNNSRLADRKFTVVGFAHRPGHTPASASVFGVPNRDGMVACAQAIVYNLNSQKPDNGPPMFQPEVGWDTLNWEPPVTGSGAYEFKEGDTMADCPRIKLNWQAKLVPVSRLGEAARSGKVGAPFDRVLERLGPNPNRLLTH